MTDRLYEISNFKKFLYSIYFIFSKYKIYFKLKFYYVIQPYAIWRLKKIKFKDLNKLVDFSFNWLDGIIRPMQIKEEILDLLKIIQKQKPKIVLEIGTANGGTLFLWTRVAAPNATIISVDLPEGMFGGGYPDWKMQFYKAFALPSQNLHLIRADSHNPETLERVKRILNGEKIDFLFIDGDHIYKRVKNDFEMYSSLVKNGGIIVFYDIVLGPEENVGGAPNFWKKVKNKFIYKEIVNNWNQCGYGIDIIYWRGEF